MAKSYYLVHSSFAVKACLGQGNFKSYQTEKKMPIFIISHHQYSPGDHQISPTHPHHTPKSRNYPKRDDKLSLYQKKFKTLQLFIAS